MHKTEAFRPTRALQSAWDLCMKAPLPMWVGGLILVAVNSVSGMGGGVDFSFSDGRDFERFIWLIVPAVLAGFLFTLVMLGVIAWLKIGYYRGVEEVMKRGDVEFEKLFKAQSRWLSTFLALLLQTLLIMLLWVPLVLSALVGVAVAKAVDLGDGGVAAIAILAMLAYVPFGVYVFLGLLLLPYPAALDGMGPIESLSYSWRLSSGVRWQLFLMLLLYMAMTLVGLMACCVGVLPAGILGEVMFCEAYVQATREDLGDWWVTRRADPPEPPESPAPRETEVASVTPAPMPPRTDEADREASDADAPSAAPPEPADSSTTEGGQPASSVAEAAPAGESEDDPEDEGPFDPSAWRRGSDIPPIDG